MSQQDIPSLTSGSQAQSPASSQFATALLGASLETMVEGAAKGSMQLAFLGALMGHYGLIAETVNAEDFKQLFDRLDAMEAINAQRN